MAEQTEPTHVVDPRAHVVGWVQVALGAVLFLVFIAFAIGSFNSEMFTDKSGVVLLVFSLVPFGMLLYGVRSVLTPTAFGVVNVRSTGLELTLRGNRRILLPWTAVDRWGVASRRSERGGALVVWPAADAPDETRRAAERLWSKRYQGWTIATREFPDELITDLGHHAPGRRQEPTPEG